MDIRRIIAKFAYLIKTNIYILYTHEQPTIHATRRFRIKRRCT